MADVPRLPSKLLLFGRGFRVAGTCGAAWTRPLYRENIQLHTTMCLYREKVTSSAEDLGWRYLNPRGSYSAVCNQSFPIQGEVAPKVKNCSKTFMRIPSEGYALFAHPRRVILSFCHKSFGFLKGIFQNPLKQVRTESATFRCGQSPRPFGLSSLTSHTHAENEKIGRAEGGKAAERRPADLITESVNGFQ